MGTWTRIALSVLLIAGIGGLLRTPSEAVSLGKHSLKLTYTDETDGYTMPYRLFLPEDYEAGGSFPVLLFLHGAGQRGTDNENQLTVGVNRLFRADDRLTETIIICPQCPEGEQWVDQDWSRGNYSTETIPESRAMRAVLSILDRVESEYRCDTDRVYAVGLSMGGFGVWDLLARHGERFAAGVPVCGGGDPEKAEALSEIPIWAYHGEKDPVVPFEGTKEMYESVSRFGKDRMIFTPIPDGEHAIWDQAFRSTEMIEWLFAQNLSLRAPAPETEAETDGPAPSGGTETGWLIPAGIAAGVLVLAAAVFCAVRGKKHGG